MKASFKHVYRYLYTRANREQSVSQGEEGGIDLGEVEQNLEDDSKQTETMPMKPPRPVRTRHTPKRFEDFVLILTVNILTLVIEPLLESYHLISE